MMHALTENCKVVTVCQPQLKDNGAATVTYADCKGWDHATFVLLNGTVDTTTDAKLQECDTSGGTYADITGAAITQLSATDDDKIAAIEVDLTKLRKRYLKPVITAGDGTTGCYVAAVIILTRGEASPANAAAAGLAERVSV
jgi:hypothetical protein